MPNLGAQAPRIEWIPPGSPHPDQEAAVEFAEAANFTLQDWQNRVFGNSLFEKRPGKWASFENALVVPRQNGKTELAIARMLAGTLVLGERLVVYTAHLAKTSEEVFRRTRDKLDEVDWIAREVKHIWRANGREAIEFRSGARILFQTRTPSSGRGFAKADCVFVDEAMYLPMPTLSSILFILGRARNPQLWYLGSSPDQIDQPDSVALAAVRQRAIGGGDASLYYAEWSMPYDHPAEVPEAILGDPAMWAASNPAYGAGLPEEQVANEYRATPDKRIFAIERGGVGDWPSVDGSASVISLEQWDGLTDAESQPLDPVCFVFDVQPERAFGSISVAGKRADGQYHVELVDRRRGTDWMPDRIKDLTKSHRSIGVLYLANGAANTLAPLLAELHIEAIPIGPGDYAAACGLFFDFVDQSKLRHRGQTELASAIRGAVKRIVGSGESWTWSRPNSSVDISPLVGHTLALWGASTLTKETEPLFAWA